MYKCYISVCIYIYVYTDVWALHRDILVVSHDKGTL